MKLRKLCLATTMLALLGTTAVMAADSPTLNGFVTGATVMDVSTKSAQIDEIPDVIYEQIKDTRTVTQMHMSVLVPRTKMLKPAIIYFPGGGFTSSDHDKFIEMRMALAQSGYVVAAATYRVVPNKFPAPVIDGKAAVRFLRQHASEYNIDPHRIGVLGDSAGGWLVQMLGTTNDDKTYDKGDFLNQSSNVQAVATLYGISDLQTIGAGFPEDIQKVHESPAATEALLINGPAFRTFAGKSIRDSSKKALEASSIGHMGPNKPPFLIMHGSADSLVSPQQSAVLYKALKKYDNSVDYIVVKGAEHGDNHWYQPAVINEVVNWFHKKLGEPIVTTKTTSDPDSNL